LKTKVLSALILSVVVSGCVPTQAYFNGSVSQNRSNDLLTSCQADAAKTVPTSIENQVTGGFFVGYVWIPTTSDVDTNDPLRQKVVAQCMAKRGFTRVELPACENNVAVPDMTKPASVTENSCFKAINGGYYAIADKRVKVSKS
jgi:hypothetical protein